MLRFLARFTYLVLTSMALLLGAVLAGYSPSFDTFLCFILTDMVIAMAWCYSDPSKPVK